MTDNITKRQTLALLFVFLTGSSMSMTGDLGRDGWLSILIAAAVSVPLYWIYLRPVLLCPDQSFFSINRILYGKVIGQLVNVFYTILCLVAAFFALSTFVFYINTISLSASSRLFIGLFMIIIAVLFARNGVLQLSKWAEPTFWLILVSLILSVLMTVVNLDANHLKPFFYNGARPVLRSALSVLSLPFLEGFFLVSLIERQKEDRKNYLGSFGALILSGIMICLIFLRNLMLLGYGVTTLTFYPSYTAASLITLGEFFQREEVLVTGSYVLCDLLKITILLVFAVRGTQCICPKMRFQPTIWFFALFLLGISTYLFRSVMVFQSALSIYKAYLPYPLIVLPAVSWLIAEIKYGVFRRKASSKDKKTV